MRQVKKERQADKSGEELNDAIVEALQFVELEKKSTGETEPDEIATDAEDDDDDMFA